MRSAPKSPEDGLKIEIRVVYEENYAKLLADIIKVGKSEKSGQIGHCDCNREPAEII
jgi:hypothetical protein